MSVYYQTPILKTHKLHALKNACEILNMPWEDKTG